MFHNHSPNFRAICAAVPEIRKKGCARAHVPSWTLSLTSVSRLASRSLATSEFQRNPSRRFLDAEEGAHLRVSTFARAD